MILSDKEILNCIEQGRIIIDPFNPEHLNPNSVDLTLNPMCKIYKKKAIFQQVENLNKFTGEWEPLDCRKKNEVEEFEITESGFVLHPNTLYLYSCNEKIGVPVVGGYEKDCLCAEVIGKSSLGRLGLFIQITAGWIDSGFIGSLVLELTCVQPLRIYPNQKICQVNFTKVFGEINESYDKKDGSKYMHQIGTQESLMHKNFE